MFLQGAQHKTCRKKNRYCANELRIHSHNFLIHGNILLIRSLFKCT